MYRQLAPGHTSDPVMGSDTVGSHGIAHITNESSQLSPSVVLQRTCLTHSSDCNAVVIASEYILCIIESSARKELRDLLLGSIYDDLSGQICATEDNRCDAR